METVVSKTLHIILSGQVASDGNTAGISLCGRAVSYRPYVEITGSDPTRGVDLYLPCFMISYDTVACRGNTDGIWIRY
jgi:hypothetical protein